MSQACPVGSEGCACTQGGACDAGLECHGNLCVLIETEGTPSSTGAVTTSGGSADSSSATGSSTGTSSGGGAGSAGNGGDTVGTTASTSGGSGGSAACDEGRCPEDLTLFVLFDASGSMSCDIAATQPYANEECAGVTSRRDLVTTALGQFFVEPDSALGGEPHG